MASERVAMLAVALFGAAPTDGCDNPTPGGQAHQQVNKARAETPRATVIGVMPFNAPIVRFVDEQQRAVCYAIDDTKGVAVSCIGMPP